MQPTVVGIDLGTTFSLASYMNEGKAKVVRDESGNSLVPSVICFHEDGSVSVGSEARERALKDPEHTIFSVKRLMGRTLHDLQRELKLIPHQIVEREIQPGRKVLHVRIGNKEYTPEELSAMILKEVRKRAGNPTKAVITVPAYFDDSQRQATRDAGRIAGLDVLRIVNEPTAAALAYGLDQKKTGTIAVYDLGGGTFDCSVLSLSDGIFKVLSTNGDTYLGGDDFDREIMKVVANELRVNFETPDAELLQYLRDSAEKTKIQLTSEEKSNFQIELPSRKLSYRRIFARSEFESLIAHLIDRSIEKCRNALRDAKLKPNQIDEVVLVGGSTRIPYVRQRVESYFGRKPHTQLNPDEVVAIGAAIQADILATGHRDTLLLDVVPLSLGIETLGGVVDKVIHRNATVPCRSTTRYSTFADNQTAININIYQGERELTKDCKLLGRFKLGGIPPMPAQFPQIDIAFLVDHNGMLTVSASENRSGKQASVTIQPSHGLSPDEVDRLVLESIEHAQEDFATRRFIELKNKADGDLRYTEKALAQVGDQLSPDLRTRIEDAKLQLRAAMDSDRVERLQETLSFLNEVTNPLAHLQMNSVLKATLTGRSEGEMDLSNI